MQQQEKDKRFSMNRVDVQVSIFTAVIVILSSLSIYLFNYALAYDDMLDSLKRRTESIQEFVNETLSAKSFDSLNSPEDMDTELYRDCHQLFYDAKQAAGVQYLYTAKQNDDGSFVYVVDGLDPHSKDFRQPGDAIESEIVPKLKRALDGDSVWPDDILDTGWGKIFISYLPIHKNGEITGVIGIEFEAEESYNTYRLVRFVTPLVILITCLIAVLFAVRLFHRISNPTYRDLSNTDFLTQMKNRNSFEMDLTNLSGQKWPQNICIIVIDLNNLKKINDLLGHSCGDIYLKAMAQAIKREIPQSAVAYRVGGDEFAILSRDIHEEDFAALNDRMQAGLIALCPDGWPVNPSFAAGFAVADPQSDADLYETYRRADRNMYRAKEAFHEKEK